MKQTLAVAVLCIFSIRLKRSSYFSVKYLSSEFSGHDETVVLRWTNIKQLRIKMKLRVLERMVYYLFFSLGSLAIFLHPYNESSYLRTYGYPVYTGYLYVPLLRNLILTNISQSTGHIQQAVTFHLCMSRQDVPRQRFNTIHRPLVRCTCRNVMTSFSDCTIWRSQQN